MNVLLTCAGRRRETLRAFQAAVAGTGKVFACDASEHAPVLQCADGAFLVPRVAEPHYIQALLELCLREEVDLVIPSMEPELPKLAAARGEFLAHGITPVVSPLEVVETCFDKLHAGRFLNSIGLATPRTFSTLPECAQALARGEVHFPMVVKPRWGVSSIGTYFVEDTEELELAFRLAHKQVARTFLAEASSADAARCILIQEALRGDEYGLDVVNDLAGTHVCSFAKKKVRMRAGQTDQAFTVDDPRLHELGRRLGEALRHIGMLDCDLFDTPEGLRVIDLNPRMGGGYPFAQLAGANYPAALLAWARGEQADPRWLQMEPNVFSSTCDAALRHRALEPVADEKRGSEPIPCAA